MANEIVEDLLDAASTEPLSFDESRTFGTSQLEIHARELGVQLAISLTAPDLSKSYILDFEENVRIIESAYALAVDWARDDELHSPIVDWLLDNYYIISEQVRDIRAHMPRSFFRELPKLKNGRARIHVLAEELLLHCDCALDEQLILKFAENFQIGSELTIGESWAFAVMLRLVLVERLRYLCEQLEREYRSIQAIEPLLEGLKEHGKLTFADLSKTEHASALIAISTAIKELGSEKVSARVTFDDHLEAIGWSLTELQKREQHRLAASQVSVSNIVTSMRLLGVLDWTKTFEAINATEKQLREDPAQVYPAMDFASRNRYRNVVEELAKRSSVSESTIVRMAIEWARKEVSTKASDPLSSIRTHVGYWLVDDGLTTLEEKLEYKPKLQRRIVRWARRHPEGLYFGLTSVIIFLLLAALTIFLLASNLSISLVILLAFLALIPSSEVALLLTNAVVTKLLPVELLPKLSLESGVPKTFPTFVVVPSMLTSEREAESLLARIESHFLSNMEAPLCFALLTDFADAEFAELETDAVILKTAVDGIRKLNRKYTTAQRRAPFYLFHRKRTWNDSERGWMGWERKRGKLIEFDRLILRGTETTYIVQEGDMSRLNEFRDPNHHPFVVTLDSDTILPRGTAKKLIATLAHPLNRAIESSDKSTCILRGYSILQPRVSVHLGDTSRSRYLKVFANNPGIDPYSSAASDVYQDLFQEGSFTGKGIYDLRSFDRTIDAIFPENRILSHDLIEGCHARVGLVSDIEVYDGFPSRYDTDSKRMHRWVRGDWQILSWLFPHVPTEMGYRKNPLSIVSRWKIFDNLRRSMVAPTTLIFVLVGWLLWPPLSWLYSMVVAIVIFSPAFVQASLSLIGWSRQQDFFMFLKAATLDTLRSLEQAFYAAAFLPHKALMMSDAILRTIFRLFISKKNLLEWETAAATESRLTKKSWVIVRQLSVCTGLAVLLFCTLKEPLHYATLPWLTLWLLAPLLGQLISQPNKSKQATPSNQDAQFLLSVVSSTWGYFERFVGQDGNWLPPDNVQEYPREKIAYRISPTNEGLFLVSGMVANQLGFASTSKLLELWENNLDSWLSLEQTNGHHFNWYETRAKKLLAPRYVSTVDSGNLLACYLTLSSGIEDLSKQPILSERHVDGAIASLNWLRSTATKNKNLSIQQLIKYGSEFNSLKSLEEIIQQNDGRFRRYTGSFLGMSRFCQDLRAASEDLQGWLNGIKHLSHIDNLLVIVQLVANRFESLYQDVTTLLPWLHHFASTHPDPSPSEVASISKFSQWVTPQICLLEAAKLATIIDLSPFRDSEKTYEHSKEVVEEIESGSRFAQSLLERLYVIRRRCNEVATNMDFRFLYNPSRKLFSIGFNAESNSLDRGHYDLLCSECRLSSFLAIGKGDVETEHWFRLGRQATRVDGRYTLLSWGGSMFEYLMPTLFQKSYEGSLIDRSCKTAISCQIAYAAKLGRPWGISESAYSAMGSNSDYQYKSFGVPGLGLKRGLSKDYVISPYSSALAVPFDVERSTANLRQISEFAVGSWGFYDAVDFTRTRMRKQENLKVVQNYMAHHQGMTILAIANALDNNRVQEWFHSSPLVRANELLLQERVPHHVISDAPNPDEMEETDLAHGDTNYLSRQIKGFHSSSPRTLVLSNGRFHSMISHSGGGYCSYDDYQVTRWRSDATRDHWGSFLYLRDLSSEEIWSAAYQPTRVIPDEYDVLLSVDKGEIRRRQGDIESVLDVVVSPEHNAEVRQLRLTNHGTQVREIEVTSYMEVGLTSQDAYIAHPAFQKLFIETEYVAENTTLIARKRPRDASQLPNFALHTIALPVGMQATIDFETSREQFLGRCRTPDAPLALDKRSLSQTVGAVLDPIFSLRCVVKIAPGESINLGFTTAVAEHRDQALMLADLYHDLRGVQRAFELAWAFAQVELRHLELSAKQVHLYQQLGSYLLYPDTQLRHATPSGSRNRLGQSALWRFGISGDSPILLARISEATEVDFVRELVSAHHFLRHRGIRSDLVICNDHPSTYFDALQEQIQAVIDERDVGDGKKPSIFLIRGTQLTAEDHQLLDGVATVFLRGKLGSLSQQINSANTQGRVHRSIGANRISLKSTSKIFQSLTDDETANDLVNSKTTEKNSVGEFENGYGCFIDNGYEILTRQRSPTPAPWINVIANAKFGCTVSEIGSGYTWYGNSRENKLTTWSNDPVSDSPSEIIYLRDEDTGETWSPLNLLDATYDIRVHHGQGFSRFMVVKDEVKTETHIVVDPVLAAKIIRVTIQNQSDKPKNLQVTYYAETVLGASRESTCLHQSSFYDRDRSVICMINGYHPDYPSQVAFLKLLGSQDHHWTGDRRAFLGRDGSWIQPIGIEKPLDGKTGSGLDPCLAIQKHIELPAEDTLELVFLFGSGIDIGDARDILDKFQEQENAATAIQASSDNWEKILGTIEVCTPNRSFDLMVNRWLPYQTLSCRVWGRSACYQSGGAYGFRDQLQDVMAIVYARPDITRDQILRAAARQYIEGDVQHWWHPPRGRGTRTRFSDDFLFLPFVTLQYLRVTGDFGILSELVPYLESPRLIPHEHERYEQPQTSSQNGTLLEHCKRAILHGVRDGRHGLPLIGCGDWNDGMNKVGEGGEGESVWVGWFQIKLYSEFARLLEKLDDEPAFCEQLQNRVRHLRQAIETHAWDGRWYKRAFMDDGSPLGSNSNEECKIDSIVQSWAVIADGKTPRSELAFRAAVQELFMEEEQLLLLFTPPFDKSSVNPGYIRGYLPGVRENGGQYTHAAIWLVKAATLLGDGELAMQLFDAINPILHSDTRKKIDTYKVEPYVVAADVYSNPQHIGRGGWTWYTGSAAWMYRIAIEDILGMKIENNSISFRPAVPHAWSEFSITLRRNDTRWRFRISLSEGDVDASMNRFPLIEDGKEHTLDVTVSRHPACISV